MGKHLPGQQNKQVCYIALTSPLIDCSRAPLPAFISSSMGATTFLLQITQMQGTLQEQALRPSLAEARAWSSMQGKGRGKC